MSATGNSTEGREAVACDCPLTEVLQHKLLVIIHRACSEIRYLTDQKQRVFDLADTVEFIPEEIRHWRPHSLRAIKNALGSYQRKYPRMGVDYLAVLDMDDAEFDRSYIHPPKPDMTDPQVREFIFGPGGNESPDGKLGES